MGSYGGNLKVKKGFCCNWVFVLCCVGVVVLRNVLNVCMFEGNLSFFIYLWEVLWIFYLMSFVVLGMVWR